MTTEFKIGDHIKKVFDKQYIDNQIFEIIDLKDIKGGNWHDGFSISFVATIEPIIKIHDKNNAVEEYCIQFINYMCQINYIYAIKVD